MKNSTQYKILSVIKFTMKSNQLFHQTLDFVKKQNYVQAQQCLNQANELLLEASVIHTELLSESKEVDLLLIHAEDLLMSVQLYKSLMKEIVDLYKIFPSLKGNQ